MNDNAKDACSECWAPRPKDGKKTEETKPEAVPVPTSGVAPPTEAKDGNAKDKWKCPCCEAVNDKVAEMCAFCFAAAPKPLPVDPAPPSAAVRRPRPPSTPPQPAPAPAPQQPEATPAPPPARRRRASFVPRARDVDDRCDVQSPARRVPAADAWRCAACNTLNSSTDTCCTMCRVCRP